MSHEHNLNVWQDARHNLMGQKFLQLDEKLLQMFFVHEDLEKKKNMERQCKVYFEINVLIFRIFYQILDKIMSNISNCD